MYSSLLAPLSLHVIYSRRHGKNVITVQRSSFTETTLSDVIGYSLSNDWNTVSGMPAIGKCLSSVRNAVLLAVLT